MQSYIRKRFSQSPPDSASAETKSSSRYRPGSPDRVHLGRSSPDNFKPKSSAKSEDKSLTRVKKKHRRKSADNSEDSLVVERLKKLAEPDESVQEKSGTGTESTRSPHREQTLLLEARADRSKDETGQINAHKALALKRPAEPVSAVLEARKRRFEPTQSSDSRSVCIRSSSAAKAEGRTNLHGQLTPPQLVKSKRLSKGLTEPVDHREVADKPEERSKKNTMEKMLTEMSEISDLTSADSSMSLEDISEDDAPQVQDKRLGEESDAHSTPQRPRHASELAKQGVQQHERDKANDDEDDDDDDDDVLDRKSSTVSSVVKSVSKDMDVSEARHSVETVTRHSQSSVTEVQSDADNSPISDDDLVIRAPKRKIVNKG